MRGGPDRTPVAYPFGVVPHAVAVDQSHTGIGSNVEHAAVDVRGYPCDHVLGRTTKCFRPEPTHHLFVPTDPAGREDDRCGGEFELALRISIGGDASG